jgi:hypothetical protein
MNYGNGDEENRHAEELKEKSIDFLKIQDGCLTYIKKQENYILVSGIFPFYSLLVQILTMIATSLNSNMPSGHRPQQMQRMDMASPYILFMIFTLFSFLHFFFLLQWRNKLRKYEAQKDLRQILVNQPNHVQKEDLGKLNETSSEIVQEKPPNTNSLTNLFYNIIKDMQSIKIIFYLMNIVCIFYFQWFIRIIFRDLFIRRIFVSPQQTTIQILNFIAQIGMCFYMIYEWKHFNQWNKKLKKLNELELKIYNELELN